MTYEEKIIEKQRKEIAELQAERAEFQKALTESQKESKVWEHRCRDAERRTFNAEQEAKLANDCIKEMKRAQALLNGQIENLNHLQTHDHHGK